MHWIFIKFIILTLVLKGRAKNVLQYTEMLRSIPPPTSYIKNTSHIIPFQYKRSLHQQPLREGENNREALIHQTSTENVIALENTTASLNEDFEEITSFLVELESCRKNYSEMDNLTFNLKLYNSLLKGTVGTPASEIGCNISKELTERLQNKISQLDVFKDIFVPKAENTSVAVSSPPLFNHPPLKSNVDADDATFYHESMLNDELSKVKNDLVLKLEEDWMENKPKVLYMSHIYLGSSLYPFITEESRVIDKKQTTSSLITTKAGYTLDTKATD